jgi:cyanophycinase-like exopeptidase
VTAGLFGLLGSGEFEPWSEAVDRALLSRASGDGSVLILPTASAAEGDDVFDRWGRMGKDHFDGMGVSNQILPLKTRADAEDTSLAEPLERASVAYFSGGNPAYLAGVLSGTAFWDGVLRGLERGMAYIGCSAGIACLGEVAADSAARSLGGDVWQPGLRLFPHVHFGPHWDALDRFVPGLRSFIEASVPPEDQLLAVDERTAVVGDGTSWTVVGVGSAHLRQDGQWTTWSSGTPFDVALGEAIRQAEGT